LEVLKLAGNQLTSLPESIRHWKKLRMLVLGSECSGGNLLRELPGAIGELASLQELDLSHNQLARLPEAIGNLRESLRTLSLYHNRLEELPETIFTWTNLKSLNLARNRLTQLPDALLDWSALEMVDVSYNQLHLLSLEQTEFLRSRSLLLVGNPFDYKKAVDIEARKSMIRRSSSYIGGSSDAAAISSSLKSLPSLYGMDFQQERPTLSGSSSVVDLTALSSTAELIDADSMDLSPEMPTLLDDNSPKQIQLIHTTDSQTAAIVNLLDRPLSVVPSLLELCARTIVENKVVPHEAIPPRLVSLLCLRGGSCVVCNGVYVQEFHSHIRPMPHYMDSTHIPHRMNLCSQRCWKQCAFGTSGECHMAKSLSAADLPDATPNNDSAYSSPMMHTVRRRTTSKREKKRWKWKERLEHFQASISQGDLQYEW
jgi:Leucine-rich repeat (LRR) protein